MERFLKYYNYTKNWALSFCQDNDLAFDITQNVYLKLSKSKTEFVFNYESEVKAYLKRAVKNEYINHYRLNKDKVIIDIDQDVFKNTIPQKSSDELFSDELQYALSHVPDKLKLPFIFAHYHEYSYDEIGAILKIPEGTVKARIHSAKQELKYRIQKFRKKKCSLS